MLIFVTVASFLLALTTSLIALRVVRDERRRSAARVELLARDLRDRAPAPAPPAIDELPLRPDVTTSEPSTPARGMFAATTPTISSGSRWGLAFAIGAF